MTLDIDTVFRDNKVKGDIHSGAHEPDKAEIRAGLRAWLGGSSNPSIVKQTKTALDAVTPASENYGGLVLNDPDPAKNGYYYRSAAAWVFGRGFPDTFAKVTLAGSGTVQTGVVNAGVNPASVEVFFAKVVTPNTGALTLSISGEAAKPVVNLAGNPLSAGEWTGMVMFYLNDADQYQLLLDAGSAASAAASATSAGADADRAESAADAAEAAVSSVSVTSFPSIAAAAAYSPAVAPSFLRLEGYATAGDLGGALYKKVALEPSHTGKFSITLADAVTVTWYEIAEAVLWPQMFGYTSGDVSAFISRALDVGDHIYFPDIAAPYAWMSNVTKTLTRDKIIDFNGQKVQHTNATLHLRGATVASGLLPQTLRARYATDWIISNSAGILPGDLLFVNTTIAPSSDWADTKKDLLMVRAVNHGTQTLTLDAGLNFAYTTGDAGITCAIYRPVKVTLIRPNLEMMADTTPQIMVHLEALRDVEIVSPRLKGQYPYDRANGIYRIGIQLWKCWRWTVTDGDYEAMSYPIGVYGGSRHGTEINTRARYCHHSHADLGDWASDYRLIGLDSNDSYQALNRHPSLRCFAENFNVQNDYGLSNWRGFGGGWKNGRIQSTVDDTAEYAQFQSDALSAGYEYLYQDADANFENVVFDIPGRITKPVLEVRKGRNVYYAGITAPSLGVSLSPANLVQQVIIGPGNKIGTTKAPSPSLDGGLFRAAVRVHVPPLVPAEFDGSMYHINPRKTLVDQSGGFLKCYGPIFAGNTSDPIARTIRVHLNAFGGFDTAQTVVGQIELIFTLVHQNTGFFSSKRKIWNFVLDLNDGLVFPPTPIFSSSPSGQTNESGDVTVGTFASSVSTDTYAQFAATLTSGGRTSPVTSLDYELILRKAR